MCKICSWTLTDRHFLSFKVREARKRREERIATKKQELLQSFAKEEEQLAATQAAKK